MFDEAARAEVIARFDELVERCYPSKTAALLEEIGAAARAENRAAAAQLDAVGRLFGYRLSRCSDTEEWAIDTMEALAAEVGAALRISQGMAASRVRYARAMRERLPKVAEVFKAGDIDYRSFQTMVYRRGVGGGGCHVGGQCGALAFDESGPAGCAGGQDRGEGGCGCGAPAPRGPA
jgi:hypothetical protein